MTGDGDVVLAEIRVRAPAAWQFHQFDGLVLARRDTRAGSLQISTAFGSIPRSAPGATCANALREWLAGSDLGSIREARGEGEEAFGWADLGSRVDEGRAWYLHVESRLLLAVYRGSGRAPRQACEVELEEAARIVRSARWRYGNNP